MSSRASDPTLRRASVDDAAALAELFWQVRAESVPRIPMVVHPRASVQPFLRGVLAEQEVWVAEAGTELVGFLALEEPGVVRHLYVQAAHTGQGLGTRFLALARERFPAGLELWTFQSNEPAQRFYSRHDFVPVEWTDSDNEEGEPDVRMTWRPHVWQTVAAYDRDAAEYAAGLPPLSPHLHAVLDRFAAALPPAAAVLEIGSGPGIDAEALEQRGLRVHRTDISQGFVDLLRARGWEATQLDPMHDHLGGPWDAVYASACLLHVPRADLATVLRRLREATAPRGVLYLDLKEGDGEGWSTHGSVRAPRHFTYWREGPLREVLGSTGWVVGDVQRNTGRRGDSWLEVSCRRADPV